MGHEKWWKDTRRHYGQISQQSRWGFDETSRHFMKKDEDHDYDEEKPFDWIRGTQVCGRSLIWGRQTYRWSDLDFEANAKDGIAVDWPIRYKDIEPWYAYVEKHVGISGESLGLPQLPDSVFLKPMVLNCVEEHLKEGISKNYNDRVLKIGQNKRQQDGRAFQEPHDDTRLHPEQSLQKHLCLSKTEHRNIRRIGLDPYSRAMHKGFRA